MPRLFTINHNGTFYSSDLILSVNNRGFHYGDSLFESILVLGGKVQFWDYHYARLLKGAAILGYTFYPWWTEDYFRFEILKTLNENKLNSARVKLSLYREDGGKYQPINDQAKYLISLQSIEGQAYLMKDEGLKAGVYDEMLKPLNILSSFKNGNSLLYVLASRKAKNEAWDQIILLNERGEICETGNGNIFIIRDGNVYTPPIESGCVAGVMRMNLIQLLEADGWKLTEKILQREELDLADEIWSCNASGGIQYISSCGLREYKNEWALKAHNLLIKQINER